MGRTARDRTRDRPAPVTKIELAANPPVWKGALAVLFLFIGVGALVYGFMGLLTPQTGWQAIQANATEEASCADDFVFLYPLGARGGSARAEERALKALYTQAAADGYRLFSTEAAYADVYNISYLNRHPNETVELDPALYGALEQIAASGDRTLYLAPAADAYRGLFTCEDDTLAAEFDPYSNDALRAYCGEIAAFARDPAQIDLRLLDGNRAELYVSDAYLTYAREQEIDRLIDFGFMKNAFLADYLAGRLISGGYAMGTLSSFDGFVRNLDAEGGTEYALNLYDLDGTTVYPAAKLYYAGARAFCSLRAYPLAGQDDFRFYAYRDGTVRVPYPDARDGLPKAATHDLTLTSDSLGCAGLLLTAIPVYVADAFDEDALAALAQAGVHSAYCAGRVVRCTDEDVRVGDLLDTDDVRYRAE